MKKQMSMILAGLLMSQAALALGACAKDRSQDGPELGVVVTYTTSPSRPTRAEETATDPSALTSNEPDMGSASQLEAASAVDPAADAASTDSASADTGTDSVDEVTGESAVTSLEAEAQAQTVQILPMNDEVKATQTAEGDQAQNLAEMDANQSYREGVFVLPEALDPWRSEDQASIHLLYALFQPLLGVRADGVGGQSLYYAAADQVTCSEDELTYTFHLREGAKWSDGEPVKAGEFVEGLAKIFDPAAPSPFYPFFETIENASAVAAGTLPLSELGISAPDDSHLVIRLARPHADFLQACAMPCAIPYRTQMHALRMRGSLVAGGKGVCNGPYMIESWGDAQVVLTKNPYFHAEDRVHLSPLIFTKFMNRPTALEALDAGKIDRVSILGRVDDDKDQPRSAKVEKRDVLMPLTHFLFFQCQKPPFDQVKIRQALGLTVDRQLASNLLGEEAFVAASGWLPPHIQVGKEMYRTNTPDYFSVFQNEIADPKALLIDGMKEAGLGEDPGSLTLELATGARREGEKELIEALAKEWEEKLGIHVRPVVYPWPSFLEKIRTGALDVAYEAWRSEMPTPYPLMRLAGSDQSSHLGSFWKNEAYDDLLAKAEAEADPSARLALYQEAESILIRDMSVVPLAYAKKITYLASSLRGLDLSPQGSMSYVGAYFSGRDLSGTNETPSASAEQGETGETETAEATETTQVP